MIENIPPCSRKKGCFCTFNDFKTFVQLSFPSLPQISTSFPNHAFRNAHFSRVRAFQQGKPPLYFVACYYAQYRMRSAILRNQLILLPGSSLPVHELTRSLKNTPILRIATQIVNIKQSKSMVFPPITIMIGFSMDWPST